MKTTISIAMAILALSHSHAVVPAAPSNLTATAVSPTQVNLAWQDNSNNEQGFRAKRLISGTYTTVGTVGANVTTFSDTTVLPGTTYSYKVQSYNQSGGSPLSNVATVTTPNPTPTPTPTPSAKKILHWQAGPNSGQVASVVANKTYIDTLPFDGIVVRFPDYQDCLSHTYAGTYTTLYNQLSPMNGLLTHVKHNYASVLIGASGMVDPFDDWTAETQRWVNLAMACRDAGLEGILFDNEEYGFHLWQYPTDCIYAGSKTVSQYQEQWRLRGNQVMAAVIAQWPAAKILVTIDPARSTSDKPSDALFNGDPNWLGGFFALGMFAAAPGHVINGGEHYYSRTTTNFSNWLNFMTVTLTQSPSSPPLIPASLASTWQAQINQSYGIYDQDTVGNPDMTYSVLQTTLVNSVPYATEFVWNYDEQLDWLNPNGGATANWKNAVWNARGQLGLPTP